MPNYLDYRKSISNELIFIKDRVRNFIDSNHWGEDGRYKEIILSQVLKNVLPQNVTVATGFVMGSNETISSQIDIIIYRNDYPVLFKIADFVVVPKESVIGIIEVKSNLWSNNISKAIENCHKNGQLIGSHIFNGIFGYETEFKFRDSTGLSNSIEASLCEYNGYLNNICFGKDYFMKYWDNGNPDVNDGVSCCSFYKIEDLAFGYFISNLIEDIYRTSNGRAIDGILRRSLYPIEGSKEAHRLDNFEIKFSERE